MKDLVHCCVYVLASLKGCLLRLTQPQIDPRKLITFLALGLLYNTSSLAQVCSTDSNEAIPLAPLFDVNSAGTPASIDIVVGPEFEGTVEDLDFQLAIDHSYVGDLVVTLTSPEGTVVSLLDRPGRPAAFFGCFRDNVDVILDDEALADAEDECADADPTIAGTLRPSGSLSDFNDEVFAGTWRLTAIDFYAADSGSIISAGNCLNATTTPVTISSFETRQRGNSLVAKWQTSSEAFNLGFHLWGKVAGDWQQLNRELINSHQIDSVEPQNYRSRIKLSELDDEVTEVGISSVSTAGKEEFYGPFAIGERYGEESVPRYIDWQQQREAHTQSMQEAGYVKHRNRWIKNNSRRAKRNARRNERHQERYQDTLFEIEKMGIYRVRYEDLLAQGIDYQGAPINKLALSVNNQAVARIVKAGTESRNRFGPGSEIIFFANDLPEDSARYVDRAFYRLSLDRDLVLKAPNLDSRSVTRQALQRLHSIDLEHDARATTHRQSIEFGGDKQYSFAMQGNGWFDSSVRAFGGPNVKAVTVNVPTSADLNEIAELSLAFVGVVNFPRVDVDGDGELEPNHHYKIYLNRDQFAAPVYEGFSNGFELVDVDVATSGQLQHGENIIELELIPNNEHNVDIAYFVEGSLSFITDNAIDAGAYWLDVETPEPVIEVIAGQNAQLSVYSTDDDNNFSETPFVLEQELLLVPSPHNPSLTKSPKLWFISDEAYFTPNAIGLADKVDEIELDLHGVDYVLIADASLLGDDLQRFSDAQNELGRVTKVVTTQAIYNKYSNGSALPKSIARYLAEQALTSDYGYVLLVGGHTYDYLSNTVTDGEPLLNLLPSFYRSSDDLLGILQQIPTAVPFVDFDGDGRPDRAIGRWPVRDRTQLKNVVDKTLAWHAEGSHKDQQTSLFIAGAKEPENDFSGSSERLISSLGLDLNPWPSPQRVFADQINADDSIAGDDKLRVMRDNIVEVMNQGPALTVFYGHASPSIWGKQTYVNADVADQFTNTQAPSLIIPLACYTTYYEGPVVKSLSEVLFTDNAAGAVALSGASLLSRAGDNVQFGRRLLHELTVSGLDLGSAVLKVKQEFHGFSERHQSVVYNWTTLGDPTLSFGLPNVTPPVVEEFESR